MEDLIVMGIIIITIGYLLGFYGYKIKRLLFVVVWFLIGFSISNQIFANSFEEIDMLHALSSIIGLLCALFSYEIELLNIFVATAWISGNLLYNNLVFETNLNIIISIIVGVIVGVLAVKFVKPLLIIVTSLIGSSIMIKGIKILPVTIGEPVLFGIGIIMCILGISYQLKKCKNIE